MASTTGETLERPIGEPRQYASRLRIWTALLTVWVVWGTTYLAIRVVNQSIPPLLGAGVRFLTAGVILFAFSVLRGDRTGDRPTKAHWRNAAIIGTLLVFGGNGLVTLGEASISSGLAALLVAVVPLWFASFDRIFYGKHLPTITIFALVTGFAGAALLAGGSLAGESDPWGVLLVIAATLSWTGGSMFARRAELPERVLVGTSMGMICGSLVQLTVGVALGELGDLHLSTVTADSGVALGYLITVGALVGYASYVWLIRNAPTELVATYAFVNPVVAVSLGALILSEPVTTRTLVAGAVIVASVAIIVMTQEPPKKQLPKSPNSDHSRASD